MSLKLNLTYRTNMEDQIDIHVDEKDEMWLNEFKEEEKNEGSWTKEEKEEGEISVEEGEIEEEEEEEEKLKFERENNFIAPPQRMTKMSIGYDVCAAHNRFLPPNGKRYKIELGLKWIFPKGYYGQYIIRSGIAARHGLEIAGGSPVIDPDYDQPASLNLVNHCGENKKGIQIYRGDRIAQLILIKKHTPLVEEVLNNNSSYIYAEPTKERNGGYGSTGN